MTNKFRLRLVVFAHGLENGRGIGPSTPADDARIDVLQQGPAQLVPTPRVAGWTFKEHGTWALRRFEEAGPTPIYRPATTPLSRPTGIVLPHDNGLWMWEGAQIVDGSRVVYESEPDPVFHRDWRRLGPRELHRFADGEDLCAWPWSTL